MSRLKDEDTKLIATFPGSATGLEVNSVETCGMLTLYIYGN